MATADAPETSDGGDPALELLERTELHRDPEVAAMTMHLGRLWAMAGHERSSVTEMRNVRSRLFGYGTTVPGT